MSNRASRYARITRAKTFRSSRDNLIIAHVGRTPKRKIRLYRVGIVVNKGKEVVFENDLPENDPRYVFEDDYGVRKRVHEIVKMSGQYSKFYDSIVKVLYDSNV